MKGFVSPVISILLDDETVADMYELAVARLEKEGVMRYEASNFAERGQECRHNMLYWRGGQYVGLGPGAHTRQGNGACVGTLRAGL